MTDTSASAIHHKFTDYSVLSNLSRLEALENTAILDSPPEEVFDRLTTLASKLLNAPIALVSLVDDHRQFFKSQIGLPEPWATNRESTLPYSFCKHVVTTGEPLIISDARSHPVLQENRVVIELGAVAYAGIPLQTTDGCALGSFCALDMRPRQWTEAEIEILRSLASAAMSEIELRLTVHNLRQSQERARALERLREDTISLIVHDLRTPLTSMLLGIQALAMTGDLNPEQKQWSAIAARNGKHLISMINDLLDISKSEGGAAGLSYSMQDVPSLVERALDQVCPLAEAKKLNVSANIPPELPAFSADTAKMLRVLVNLIGNAIDFTPEGGSVTVSAQLQDERTLHFSVRDTGEGIPAHEYDHIFERFGRVEGSRTDNNTAGGLGLTLCKMVVEAHGGRIWVESQVGQGSDFQFTVPIQPV